MKHPRRKFFKISAAGLGAVSVSSGLTEAPPPGYARVPIVLEEHRLGGSVTVDPAEGVAGEHGTWKPSAKDQPQASRTNHAESQPAGQSTEMGYHW